MTKPEKRSRDFEVETSSFHWSIKDAIYHIWNALKMGDDVYVRQDDGSEILMSRERYNEKYGRK